MLIIRFLMQIFEYLIIIFPEYYYHFTAMAVNFLKHHLQLFKIIMQLIINIYIVNLD
jgi:hypothetical protein